MNTITLKDLATVKALFKRQIQLMPFEYMYSNIDNFMIDMIDISDIDINTLSSFNDSDFMHDIMGMQKAIKNNDIHWIARASK